MAPDKRPPVRFERQVGPFEVWQGGLTLANALDRFAGGESWSRYQSRVTARFDQLRTDPRSPLSDRAEAMVRLQDMARAWEEQARLLAELRTRLIERLRAGDLLAVGFAVDTASSSTLTVIPPEAWANTTSIDWDQSGFRGKDTAFLDVRVLPSRKRQLHDSGPGTRRETIDAGT